MSPNYQWSRPPPCFSTQVELGFLVPKFYGYLLLNQVKLLRIKKTRSITVKKKHTQKIIGNPQVLIPAAFSPMKDTKSAWLLT